MSPITKPDQFMALTSEVEHHNHVHPRGKAGTGKTRGNRLASSFAFDSTLDQIKVDAVIMIIILLQIVTKY